ncbi:MAG: AIM24 family protein [Geminicoccaceae bacterium]
MASFEIVELEGARFVRIDLENDDARAEAGAMAYMRGKVEMTAPMPSPWTALKCMMADEPVIRPLYRGKGEVYLTSTMGGYYVLDLVGETWILENGAYWASDGEVELGLHRESMWTSYWAGEGLIDYQTTVSGYGHVVLNAPGPVALMELKDERLAAEGKLVIARTAGLRYSVRRPTKNLMSYWLSGEDIVRSYEGTGKVLMCTTPYWSKTLLDSVQR